MNLSPKCDLYRPVNPEHKSWSQGQEGSVYIGFTVQGLYVYRLVCLVKSKSNFH
jgi:hypothetical protein